MTARIRRPPSQRRYVPHLRGVRYDEAQHRLCAAVQRRIKGKMQTWYVGQEPATEEGEQILHERWKQRCVEVDRELGRIRVPLPPPPPNTPGYCQRDGLSLTDHPRCACCGLLIGEGHFARTAHLREGRTLCSDCYKRGK